MFFSLDLSRIADNLGDFVNDGSTIHLGDNVASLDRSRFLHGNRNINAMFSSHFGTFGNFVFDGHNGSVRSGQQKLRIGLGLAFLQHQTGVSDDGSNVRAVS